LDAGLYTMPTTLASTLCRPLYRPWQTASTPIATAQSGAEAHRRAGPLDQASSPRTIGSPCGVRSAARAQAALRRVSSTGANSPFSATIFSSVASQR